MVKIIDNIFQVGGDGLSAAGDAAVYLVVHEKTAALIDAGCGHGHAKITAAVDRCLPPGSTIAYLLLTHCHFDHAGGAALLRKHYGCKIAAHAQDAPFLERGDAEVTAAAWYNAELEPFTIDHKIHGARELFQLGAGEIEALHCPGHSPGSVVYVLAAEGRTVLFGQDIHGPLHPLLLSNHDDYISSLTRLLELEADILCEGHYGVIRGKQEVRKFIRSFIP
jgi:glyoxylase-like metal-dependent hydrolase (beta-lactamase superfamily II)